MRRTRGKISCCVTIVLRVDDVAALARGRCEINCYTTTYMNRDFLAAGASPSAQSALTDHERDGLAMARSLLSCLRRAVSLLSTLLRIMAYEPRVMILRIIVQCSFAVVMVVVYSAVSQPLDQQLKGLS